MNKSVTREEVEQQFLNAAMRAFTIEAYTKLRAELFKAENALASGASAKKLAAVAKLRRRVKLAHRALFRVVE